MLLYARVGSKREIPMSDTLRSHTIRLAASMPKGSPGRKAGLDVLAGGLNISKMRPGTRISPCLGISQVVSFTRISSMLVIHRTPVIRGQATN